MTAASSSEAFRSSADEELRFDPNARCMYTKKEVIGWYGKHYSEDELDAYWDTMSRLSEEAAEQGASPCILGQSAGPWMYTGTGLPLSDPVAYVRGIEKWGYFKPLYGHDGAKIEDPVEYVKDIVCPVKKGLRSNTITARAPWAPTLASTREEKIKHDDLPLEAAEAQVPAKDAVVRSEHQSFYAPTSTAAFLRPEEPVDDSADSHCPEELKELLKPLEREWLSWRLGYIRARQCDALDHLDVIAGQEGSETSVAIVELQRSWPSCIKLKVSGQSGKMLMLCSKSSSRGRVCWIDGDSEVKDVWDHRLLSAASKGAAYVAQEGMNPMIQEGLSSLASEYWLSTSSSSKLTVALCVTTKNRLWQLEHALPLNLIHLWKHQSWCKIYVLDCGSSDGTLAWLCSKCRAAIDSGLLTVVTTDRIEHWHASIAKNTIHLCAKEDILVNLDGDNLVGPNFVQDVTQQFENGYTVVQYEDGPGTCGRIACYRQDFINIRGYDEDAYPMGAQDVDLLFRLKAIENATFRKVKGRGFGQAIQNTQEQKVSSCSQDLFGNVRWGQMDTMNSEIFKARRERGYIKRNLSREVGVPCWIPDELL